MGKWLSRLERIIGGGPGGNKRVGTFRWMLLVGLTGMAVMILNSYVTVKDADSIGSSGIRASPPQDSEEVFGSGQQRDSEFEQAEQRYEARMKEILERIVGVGEVDVMVTIESTEEIVVEKNVQQRHQVTDEKDREGGTRHITDVSRNGEVVLYQAERGQTPVVLKRIKPEIRGVLVVAGGAENMAVKRLIVQAVERGLGVPPHRVSVVPRKQQ